jgi:hypothetical protein
MPLATAATFENSFDTRRIRSGAVERCFICGISANASAKRAAENGHPMMSAGFHGGFRSNPKI